mmetsp:Transcript_39305/g.123894  ORF Transcript_39305/g.123894 Transcript_39305/m.123894 type:complete len:151 (+) Transcript_39305:390-842(+)
MARGGGAGNAAGSGDAAGAGGGADAAGGGAGNAAGSSEAAGAGGGVDAAGGGGAGNATGSGGAAGAGGRAIANLEAFAVPPTSDLVRTLASPSQSQHSDLLARVHPQPQDPAGDPAAVRILEQQDEQGVDLLGIVAARTQDQSVAGAVGG